MEYVKKRVLDQIQSFGLTTKEINNEIFISHKKMYIKGIKQKNRIISFINNKFVVINEDTKEIIQ